MASPRAGSGNRIWRKKPPDRNAVDQAASTPRRGRAPAELDALQRHAGNVRLRKIIAPKQQGQAPLYRERIGKTVAMIQPSGMSAFAIPSPSLTCDLGLVLIDGGDFNARAVEQKFEFSATRFALFALDYDGGLQERRS